MANSEFSVVGLAHKFLLAGESVGYKPTTFNGMAEKPGLLADFLAVYEGRARIIPIEVTPATTIVQAARSTLTVLPSLTVLERIALGSYDWKNSDITESRFPHNIATVGEWEHDLYHPNSFTSSEDAKSSAEVDGWVVAEAEHLLAFGKQFPDVQRKFPIIALGSVCEVRGNRRVLGLWSGGGGRDIRLFGWRGDWVSHVRFLRVRKVRSSVA